MHLIELAPLSPDRRYSEALHNCETGWCSIAHPESEQCALGFAGLDPEDKTAVWMAALTGTQAELVAAVERYRPALTFNVERRALQAVNCEGEIALSIPLTSAQAASLLD